jgi:uncharacterized membrane protein YczE
MKKKILFTILGIIIIYADVAFAIKAGIGVMPVDAAINTIAAVLGIKVGTFSMVFHGSFFLGQILIEKKDFRKTEFLQILYITLGGTVLNFFLYTVLKNLTFSLYPIRLIVTLAVFFISAFGVTLVLETQLIRIPMDGCVQMVADRIGTTMGKLRQKIDFALVVICVLLTVVFKTQWTLREGTIIAALMFGPSMDLWKKKFFTK